jgi:hypothetical protein
MMAGDERGAVNAMRGLGAASSRYIKRIRDIQICREVQRGLESVTFTARYPARRLEAGDPIT